jgi:hypothetical protein
VKELNPRYLRTLDETRLAMMKIDTAMLSPLLRMAHPELSKEQSDEITDAYLKDVQDRPQLLKG